MNEYRRVAETEDIEPGKMKSVREQGTAVLLVNVDGNIYALNDFCTHSRCYLHEGKLKGKTLTCRCHFAEFDVTTGGVLGPPAKRPLVTYPVKVEGKHVLVAM